MNQFDYNESNTRRHKLFDLLQYNAFLENDALPKPDLQQLQTAVFSTPHIMIEDCLCYLQWCEQESMNGYIDVLHDIMNFYRDTPAFQPRLANWRNRERNTVAQHIWNIVAEARDSGELNELDAILDYLLPNDSRDCDKTILSCYEFDDRIEILPGSSEGIYLHWSLLGRFRQEQARGTDERISIATLKTLQTDLATYKIMGSAAGILEYFSQQYVANNFKLYTPEDELKKSKSSV